jgi:hypothetical protein
MNLSFYAPFVECTNALDREIQQVLFDTVNDDADDSEDRRQSPYVLIGQNFEFTGPAEIEWHDGEDYDGGATIQSAVLEPTCIHFSLDESRTIMVTFEIQTQQFQELQKYLKNILGTRLKQK